MSLFESGARNKAILGMIHLAPLPGTPFYEADSFEAQVDAATTSALALRQAGATGCLLQTVDRVYPVADEADPARVAAMAVLVRAVRTEVGPDFHVGVQILRNANRAAIAVAKVAGGSFVRASALVGATMSPHGFVQADPNAVQAYRAALGAADVALVADIDSMHFRWVGEDKPIGEIARAARLVGAAAVAVSRDSETEVLALIEAIRVATPDLPVLLAGGTNLSNARRLLAAADGAFVGTAIEADGWGSRIDPERACAYVLQVRSIA